MMVPAGYMLKFVAKAPDWLQSNSVRDIYSLSDCMSPNFADYIPFWKHNGYWLFDTASSAMELAKEANVQTGPLTLFYYEVFDSEYDADSKTWKPLCIDESLPTNVSPPASKVLQGFDVASFSGNCNAECSPLSCNGMARELDVNEHCLFRTLEESKKHLESESFKGAEPGPYRIFAVYLA